MNSILLTLAFILPHFPEGDNPDFSVAELVQLINSSCTYASTDKNVASFYNDKQLSHDTVEFPTGTMLVRDIQFTFYFLFPAVSVSKSVRYTLPIFIHQGIPLRRYWKVPIEGIGKKKVYIRTVAWNHSKMRRT
jgi:hypothetical protein